MTNTTFKPINELRWLFFDLNSYFASVEQQDRTELRGRPIAVIPSDTDATCAIAASYEAKAYGIKTGTRIYDAKKMCPDLICVLARHHKYVEYHTRIFKEVGNHIPITKVCSIDEASCKLSNKEKSPLMAEQLAHNIKEGLRRNIGKHTKCSIGLAPNAFLAKTATDMQKPDGLVTLMPKDFHHSLFKLALSDLCGIGRGIERRLNLAGINTVEQLWKASPKHIRKVWGGVGGERFWYSLHGYEVPDIATKKSMVGHSRVLDPVHRPIDEAYGVTRYLVTKACSRLRSYNLYSRKFTLGIRTVSRTYWRDEVTISPTHDDFSILKKLDEMWNRMRFDINNERLMKVSVALFDLYKKQEITLDLFATDNETKSKQSSQLTSAIDSINKRFGKDTVNVGMRPKTSSGYVGTKIAFTRVPTIDEFTK